MFFFCNDYLYMDLLSQLTILSLSPFIAAGVMTQPPSLCFEQKREILANRIIFLLTAWTKIQNPLVEN